MVDMTGASAMGCPLPTFSARNIYTCISTLETCQAWIDRFPCSFLFKLKSRSCIMLTTSLVLRLLPMSKVVLKGSRCLLV